MEHWETLLDVEHRLVTGSKYASDFNLIAWFGTIDVIAN